MEVIDTICTVKNILELKELQQSIIDSKEYKTDKLYICAGGGCIASGSMKLKKEIAEELRLANLEDQVSIVETGCLGPCGLGPVMIIGKDETFYQQVKPRDAKEIIEKHVLGGEIIEHLIHDIDGKKVSKRSDIPFFKNQKKDVLKNCGRINPTRIEDYIAFDGYQALGKVLSEMTGEQVVDDVTISGLRGRGGAGFPTGVKWGFARKSKDNVKYILCNADEGDPGAFMDRSILEGDPHSVLEGMIIGAYAIGSNQGYIYVRAEYPLAVERLQIAIEQAREYGFLGENILDSGFSFDLEIRKGSGAFVCGEETALMVSIEGKRGEPRPRPPFPAEKGLWNKPTVLNNVETFSNIPQLILAGGASYAAVGTEKSKGTKIFALAGAVKISGLVEVPVGTPLRELVFDIGGGIPNGKKYKAAQIGGPSGGCIPMEHIDVPLDYESLNSLGAIMGSGGLIVMDESSCMVDVARFFLEFVQEESCGKCVPCREGTARMLELLNKIVDGQGELQDLDELEKLSYTVKNASLCGLGQTAANPYLSTFKYFKEEYKEHILDKKCRTAVCKSLIVFEILDTCNGCQSCKKVCPVEAILGDKKQAHIINTDLCIRCGLCLNTCKFDAIVKY
jgi:NADP-reducing hydrogenase subunit HndC